MVPYAEKTQCFSLFPLPAQSLLAVDYAASISVTFYPGSLGRGTAISILIDSGIKIQDQSCIVLRIQIVLDLNDPLARHVFLPCSQA